LRKKDEKYCKIMSPGMTRKRNVNDVLDEINNKTEKKTKNILVRVDFNVPMNAEGVITDDSRIVKAIPTIKTVIGSQCNAILCSHMGRPKLVQAGKDDEETREQRRKLSLKPVAEHLSKLLEKPVIFGEDCLSGEEAIAKLPETGGGGLVLLENLRFYKGEEKNEESFTKKLASYADAYVNDAFGTCHRPHASVSGVPALLPKELCGIGSLVAAELEFLDFKSFGPKDHIAAVIGGSKISTKLPVIKGLLQQVHTLVLGGGLAFTFMKAKGVPIGKSLVEEGMVETAKELMAEAEAKGKTLLLPVDAVCCREFPQSPMKIEDTKTFDLVVGAGVEEGWMGLDVGRKSVALFDENLKKATKLVLNGPMGVFEVSPFDLGTRGLVEAIAEHTKNSGCVSVVGGGDSVAALEQFGMVDSVSYVSTGGGASLELLAGDVLPGVAAISDI